MPGSQVFRGCLKACCAAASRAWRPIQAVTLDLITALQALCPASSYSLRGFGAGVRPDCRLACLLEPKSAINRLAMLPHEAFQFPQADGDRPNQNRHSSARVWHNASRSGVVRSLRTVSCTTSAAGQCRCPAAAPDQVEACECALLS